MTDGATTVAGIVIPSTDPWFLALVAAHVALGLAAVVSGAVAMLSRKGRGRHSAAGTVYFWCLCGLFVGASLLAAVRWAEDYPLFLFGAAAFAAALFGRTAMRRRWGDTVRLHLSGMGGSYILMLIAFYVDNGHQLPVWRSLPPVAYWLAPLAVGVPLIVRALLFHPLARAGLPDPPEQG